MSPDNDRLTAEERVQERVSSRATLPGGSERILVVDDEPLVQKVSASELAKLGYAVACASSGREAVSYVQEHHVDLVLLDLIMPDMDGVETFKSIQRINPNQKAIVYSGYAHPSKVAEIQQLGARPILIKPTPIQDLAAAIRERLDAEDAPA